MCLLYKGAEKTQKCNSFLPKGLTKSIQVCHDKFSMKVMVYNIQSLNKRFNEFITLLEDHNTQLAFVTESWMTDEVNYVTATLKESGFGIIHNYRQNRAGGGTALIFELG